MLHRLARARRVICCKDESVFPAKNAITCLAMAVSTWRARRTNLLTNEHKGNTDKFVNVGLLPERTGGSGAKPTWNLLYQLAPPSESYSLNDSLDSHGKFTFSRKNTERGIFSRGEVSRETNNARLQRRSWCRKLARYKALRSFESFSRELLSGVVSI